MAYNAASLRSVTKRRIDQHTWKDTSLRVLIIDVRYLASTLRFGNYTEAAATRVVLGYWDARARKAFATILVVL